MSGGKKADVDDVPEFSVPTTEGDALFPGDELEPCKTCQ